MLAGSSATSLAARTILRRAVVAAQQQQPATTASSAARACASCRPSSSSSSSPRRAFSTSLAARKGPSVPSPPTTPAEVGQEKQPSSSASSAPFEPPPVPEGVDTSIAEENEQRRLAEERGEGGAEPRGSNTSRRGTSLLSDQELARRRQAREADGPKASTGGSGNGAGSGSKRGAPGQGDRPAFQPWYKSPTTLVLGFIPIFTFGLGYWQIERLKWKVSLIEELEDKLRKDPIRLPKHIKLEALPEFEFRLVETTGRFDYSRAMLLGPRVREGQMGYQVVVPFIRTFSDGSTADAILVNRGYITDANVEAINTAAARKQGPDAAAARDHALERALGPAGGRRIKHDSPAAQQLGAAMTTSREETIVALLPRVYPRNSFTPPNKPEKNEWFHVEPRQMADWASAAPANEWSGSGRQQVGQKVLPIYLEEIFEGHAGEVARALTSGTPIGRAPTIELRNQHAVYAATWFSLSAATGVMFALLVKRGR